MAKEKVIVITEDDLDELDGEAIVITDEELTEGDMRALFEPPLLREFIAFVSAGLPDVFLRAHPELFKQAALEQIRSVVSQVPDRALRKHLESRLEAIDHFKAAQEGQE